MFYALNGAIVYRAVGILVPEHLSPDDLTERLRANGALPTGRVTTVHPGERRPTIVSTITPIRLDYSADAPPDAPTRMILKADRGGLDPSLPGIGEREVMFYLRAAPVMPGTLLARCFDAEYSDGLPGMTPAAYHGSGGIGGRTRWFRIARRASGAVGVVTRRDRAPKLSFPIDRRRLTMQQRAVRHSFSLVPSNLRSPHGESD